jgi:hypothetical protein
VKDVIEDHDFLTQMDRIRMFPEHSDEPATVFVVDELIELNTPIESGGNWIQGITSDITDNFLSAKILELL